MSKNDSQIMMRLIEHNARLVEANTALYRDLAALRGRPLDQIGPGASPDDEDDDRPRIHPQLITKLAEGKATGEDMKSALVVRCIKSSPGQTIGQIAKTTGFSIAEARFLVLEMRRQNIIRSEGARRGTRYYMAGEQAAAEPARRPAREVADEVAAAEDAQPRRRPGRPKGSKNKPKVAETPRRRKAGGVVTEAMAAG